MEEKELTYTVGGNVNWYSHYGKQYGDSFVFWGFLEKLKTELPYDPVIPIPGIYPDNTIIQKETCTSMFIAALFMIV